MELNEIRLNGRRCLFRIRENKPTVLIGAAAPAENMIQDILTVNTEQNRPEFGVFAYEVQNWNRDFSPWQAKTGIGTFDGRACETLEWLESCAAGLLEQEHSGPLILAGYSLAGLFSLWCLSNSGLFSGCACCSGSLWFPGWDYYMRTVFMRRACSVYLSLGDREKRSRDPDIRRVEEVTVLQEQMMKTDANVQKSVFRMEQGGHFIDVPGRIARGIRWTVSQLDDHEQRG